METRNLLFSKPYLDIIFENRNQEYGAYQLRKEYERNIGIALFAMFSTIVVMLSFNWVYGYWHPAKLKPPVESIITVTKIVPPIEKPEVVEPPRPPKGNVPPPPPAEMVMTVVHNTEQELEIDSIQEDQLLAYSPTGEPGALGTPDGVEGGTAVIPIPIAVAPAPPTIVPWAEVMPEFIGGESAMLEFIRNNVYFPNMERENGVSGTAIVSFVINEDGSVSNVEAVKATTGNFKRESEKVVARMPKWKPGRQGGRAVKVRQSIPIKFVAQ